MESGQKDVGEESQHYNITRYYKEHSIYEEI
jgi:hypothetical protein